MRPAGLVVRVERDHQPAGSCAAAEWPVSIGSFSGATLPLGDGALLPVHVVLDPIGNGRYRLIALAKEGVEVNGKPVVRALVGAGDRVRVGSYEIVLDAAGGSIADAPGAPARPPAGLAVSESDSEGPDDDGAGADPGGLASRERPLMAALTWRGARLDARVLAPGELLTVGDRRESVFRLPLDAPGANGSWIAAACLSGVWHVALDAPLRAIESSAEGRPLLTLAARTDGPRLSRHQLAGKLWAPLPPGASVKLSAGDLAIELSRTDGHALVKLPKPAWWTTREGQGAIVFAMILALLLGVLLDPPPNGIEEANAPTVAEQLAQFVPPASPAKKRELERWREKLAKAARTGRARAEAEEGAAGRPNAPDRNRRRAGPKTAAEIVREHALLRALSGKATAQLFSGGALSAASAVGHLDGTSIGDARGTLGLGLRGLGRGGGGLSANTVGVGPVGALGVAGAGAVGRLGRGRATSLGIDEPASVQGGLDREVIRRVILSHRIEIRYCYEKQLSATPNLAGKVKIQFVIGADGRVTTARAMRSTLPDPEVGRCIVSKVRTWTFPKPRGGGVVVVTYPFLFKPVN